jgi:hypothetical protein
LCAAGSFIALLTDSDELVVFASQPLVACDRFASQPPSEKGDGERGLRVPAQLLVIDDMLIGRATDRWATGQVFD